MSTLNEIFARKKMTKAQIRRRRRAILNMYADGAPPMDGAPSVPTMKFDDAANSQLLALFADDPF